MIHLKNEAFRKSWLQVSLLACFAAAIGLLMFLDYFNLEQIGFFNNAGFMFEFTWKGRLFLLIFLGLFVLESAISLKTSKAKQEFKSLSKPRVAAVLLCALIPLIYIVAINFFGLDQAVLRAGELIRLDYWKANSPFWSNFLTGDWPLSLEYAVFALAFTATVLLAFGKKGVKAFSISAALLAGVAVVYMVDTMFPGGAFTPFQIIALPTAASAANVLEALGMHFGLLYSTSLASTPIITTNVNGSTIPTSIAWPCAGVHSLFLYAVLILLFFNKSSISPFHKSVYFVVGAVGTYSVNVMRVVSYFVVFVNQGAAAALIFHNIYGELLFFGWIFLYMLLIVGIQRYGLVQKTRAAFLNIFHHGGNHKDPSAIA